MKTIEALHKEHIKWKSQIEFLKKEVVILEHMIIRFEKEEGIKALSEVSSSFYNTFERISHRLNTLTVEIDQGEVLLREKIQLNSIDPEIPSIKEPIHTRKHIDEVMGKMKVLKESLYDFITVNVSR